MQAGEKMQQTRREFLEQAVAAAAVAGSVQMGEAAAADARPAAVPYAADELDRHDALGLASLVARGKVSPAELLERALRRAAAIAPLNAITSQHVELALTHPIDNAIAGRRRLARNQPATGSNFGELIDERWADILHGPNR